MNQNKLNFLAEFAVLLDKYNVELILEYWQQSASLYLINDFEYNNQFSNENHLLETVEFKNMDSRIIKEIIKIKENETF